MFMSSEELKGVVVNSKTIGAAVGVMTILATLCSGVYFISELSFETAQLNENYKDLKVKVDTKIADLRSHADSSDTDILHRLQESEVQTRQNYQQILDKFDKLTGEVTKLTIAVGNVKYRQENTNTMHYASPRSDHQN